MRGIEGKENCEEENTSLELSNTNSRLGNRLGGEKSTVSGKKIISGRRKRIKMIIWSVGIKEENKGEKEIHECYCKDKRERRK